MTDKPLPIRTFVRVGFLSDITENNIMCNKCEVTGTPATPLLAYYADRKTSTYWRVSVRDFIKEQNLSTNRQYWSHSRHTWVKEIHPANQKNGHALAKLKATADKVASREAVTLQDAEPITAYLKYINHCSVPSHKVEPAYDRTLTSTRNGTWEMLDIMNKLHPYVNNQGSTHEDYAESQMRFNVMDNLHQVHISTEDINQIAYYPTLKHMREDRPVRTRLGRYLTKYQQALMLTDNDIKNMAEKHSANMRSRGGWAVEFIEHNDEDGWLRVYDSGDVGSCMRGMNAVRVYAHEKSVLRLAYVKAGEKIIARCIVRDDEDAKGWLRVYPDPNGCAEGRYLLDYLKTNGYENQTNLDGALLQYITEGYNDDIVCPYIDYGSGGDQTVGVVTRDGVTYLEAGGGDYSATETNGYVENNVTECDNCGERTDDDDMTFIDHDNQNVCSCCRDRNYTYAYGRRYEDYFPEDECVLVGDNYYWVETIENHDIGQCEHTHNYYPNDELVLTYDGTYHYDYVTSVDRDGDDTEYVYNDNVHTLSDGTTCHERHADMYQLEIDDLALEMVEANQA